MDERTRILVVDDEPVQLELTTRVLEKGGYEVIEARTGREALSLANQHQPTLILLDVTMPGLDGLEVCRRIKANPLLENPFVVMLSGVKTSSEDQADGLAAGADGYITRPISNRELLARVDTFIRLKRTEDALRQRTHELSERVKELDCLYHVSSITQQPNVEQREMLQQIVELIPPAWQHPEITCASLRLEGQAFETEDFEETAWRQAAPIVVHGQAVGELVVCYRQERPAVEGSSYGPFLEEEVQLLKAIAEHVGEAIEHRRIRREAERRAGNLLAMGEMAMDCAMAVTDAELFKVIADKLLSMAPALFVSISTYDAESQELVARHLAVPDGLLARANQLFDGPLAELRMPVSSEMMNRMQTELVTVTDDLTEVSLGVIPRPIAAALEKALGIGNLTGMAFSDEQGLLGSAIVAMPKGHPPFPQNVALSFSQVAATALRRRQAERALRQSEAQYHQLIDSLNAGIVVHAPDTSVLLSNPRAAELLGLPDEHMLDKVAGDPAWRFLREDGTTLPPDEYPASQVLSKGKPIWNWVAGIERPDRETPTWVLVNAYPVYDDNDTLLQVVVSFADITERKRAEEKRQAQWERLLVMISHFPEILYVVDPQTYEVLFVNQVFEDMLGANPIGQPCYQAFQGFDAPCDFCTNEIILQERKPYTWEHHNSKLDRDFAVVDQIVRWPDGRNVRFEMAVDVTERKRAEQALHRYIERLRALHAIDGAILGNWPVREIAQAALSHICQLTPCQTAGLLAFDVEAGESTLLAKQCSPGVRIETGARERFPTGTFADVEALGRGRPYLVEDTLALDFDDREGGLPPPVLRLLRDSGIRSYAAVPLIAGGNLRGTMVLGATQPQAFKPEDLDIISEVGNQVAVALQQTDLRDQVERHTAELETEVAARTAELERRTMQLQVAAEVARDATSTRGLDELLDLTVALIRERFGFYHAGIFLVDDDGDFAVLRAAAGEAGRRMVERRHRLKIGETGIVGYVTHTGEPRIALDVGSDLTHFDNPLLPKTRSEMALPLQVGGQIIGALDVQSTQESAFSQKDVETLQIMADQLAVAIERTQLFEQAKKALEERLQTVIDNTPVILFAVDSEGIFTLVEGQGLEALGLETGDLVGQSAFQMGDAFPEFLHLLRSGLAGRPATTTVETPDAGFEIRCTPVWDQAGKVGGVMGVAIDVTERQQLERQVYHQERLAAVGQLAGGMAHDFNNLLMTIIFYAHTILHAEGLPPELEPLTQTIIDESRRAADLVEQVLDFSRRSPLEMQSLDFVSFLENVLDILRQTLPETIDVRTEIDAQECTIKADPTRMQQVVMNLAINARDAMPEGGQLCFGLDKLKMEPDGPPPMNEIPAGEWMRLTVADTGEGMTHEVQAHLFEPYFTTKGSEGTGLGLAQVYGIVTQHQGYIDVDSKVGRGTTFHIYLPIHREEQPPAPSRASGAPAASQGRGETILLVEDERLVREAGRAILTSLGYRVLAAASGQEALEVFSSASTQAIDLVITDLIMPEMGGKALLRELKRIDAQVKALAMTGYAQEAPQDLRGEGFLDVLRKPLDVDTLAAVIRRHLDAA